MKKESHPTLLAHLIRDIFNGAEEKRPKAKLTHIRIFQAWDAVAGESIRKQTVPQSFHYGKLTIGVRHSAWITELSFRKTELLDSLNSHLGKPLIKDIVFRLSYKSDSSH